MDKQRLHKRGGTALEKHLVEWQSAASKRMEHAQLDTETLLKAIPDMVFVMSLDGTYLDFKGGDGKVYIDNEKLIGSNIKNSSMPKEVVDQILAHNQKAVDTQSVQELTYKLSFPNDKDRYYESRSAPCEKQYVIRVVREITEKVENQTTLLNYTKRLEEFAFDISHHLRLPLANILGLANVIQLEAESHGPDAEVTNRLWQSASELDRILKDLTNKLNHLEYGK